jgi:hypothetical protein
MAFKESETGTSIKDPKKHPPLRKVRGMGSKTLSKEDGRVLLELRSKYCNFSLSDFRELLQQRTGTVATKPSISSWFSEVDAQEKYKKGDRWKNFRLTEIN